MTQQHLQPLLSGFLWGLGSSLLLILAALVAARDPTEPATATLPVKADDLVAILRDPRE